MYDILSLMAIRRFELSQGVGRFDYLLEINCTIINSANVSGGSVPEDDGMLW